MATGDTVTEKQAEFTASKEAVMEAYEKLCEAKDHFRRAAEAAGIELKEDAADSLRQGRRKIQDLEQQADVFMKEKPLATLGLAFLAGFILAHIFSRR